MAATARVIWLYACVRYWPDRELVFECVTCFYCCYLIMPRLYGEKLSRVEGSPPTRATLGEPTFHTFAYKTWGTVYTRKKKLWN